MPCPMEPKLTPVTSAQRPCNEAKGAAGLLLLLPVLWPRTK
jgi:hypothetical protein